MPYKSIARYVLLICLFLIIGVQAVIVGLPVIADTLIKQQIRQAPKGFTPVFSIEKIGLESILIRNVGIGKDVHADLVELSYELDLVKSWTGLKNFQLKKVTVQGLTLSAAVDGSNHLHFNGLDLPVEDKNKAEQDGQKDAALFPLRFDRNPLLPFIPGQVSFKNAALNLNYKGREIQIPVEIMARIDADQGRVTALGRFSPFGQPIKTIVSGDLKTGLTNFQLNGSRLSPGCLTGLFRENLSGISLSGPMDLNLTHTPGNPWQLQMSGLGVSGDNLPQLLIDSMQLNVVPGQSGSFNLDADGEVTLSDKRISETKVKFDLNAARLTDTPLNIDLMAETLPIDRMTINNGSDKTIALDNPKLNISLQGTLEDQDCRVHLTGQSLVSGFNSETTKARDIFLTAQVNGNLLDQTRKKELKFDSNFKGVGLSTNYATANLNNVRASGAFQIKDRADLFLPLTSGQLKISAKGFNAAQ